MKLDFLKIFQELPEVQEVSKIEESENSSSRIIGLMTEYRFEVSLNYSVPTKRIKKEMKQDGRLNSNVRQKKGRHFD